MARETGSPSGTARQSAASSTPMNPKSCGRESTTPLDPIASSIASNRFPKEISDEDEYESDDENSSSAGGDGPYIKSEACAAFFAEHEEDLVELKTDTGPESRSRCTKGKQQDHLPSYTESQKPRCKRRESGLTNNDQDEIDGSENDDGADWDGIDASQREQLQKPSNARSATEQIIPPGHPLPGSPFVDQPKNLTALHEFYQSEGPRILQQLMSERLPPNWPNREETLFLCHSLYPDCIARIHEEWRTRNLHDPFRSSQTELSEQDTSASEPL